MNGKRNLIFLNCFVCVYLLLNGYCYDKRMIYVNNNEIETIKMNNVIGCNCNRYIDDAVIGDDKYCYHDFGMTSRVALTVSLTAVDRSDDDCDCSPVILQNR